MRKFAVGNIIPLFLPLSREIGFNLTEDNAYGWRPVNGRMVRPAPGIVKPKTQQIRSKKKKKKYLPYNYTTPFRSCQPLFRESFFKIFTIFILL